MAQTSPLAGKPAPADILIDVDALTRAYYERRPDPGVPAECVAFGTSGHRGSSLAGTFNEDHILATTQAICEYRREHGIDGPLFVGTDTHALSEPALRSALEVFAANEAQVRLEATGGPTPTPVISHLILAANRGRSGSGPADGVVITPSHNPPADGGYKYNPPNGGPADTDITTWMQERANALLAENLRGVARIPYERARAADCVRTADFISDYVADLPNAVDIDAIRAAGLHIGVDSLGGASLPYWQAIAERHRLDVTITNDVVDPTFFFMAVDWDGKIRMDCSSPYAMARLVGLKDRFDLAFGNDTDSDRHGIVTKAGLLNPNHYLSAAISYLYGARPQWPAATAVGKTLVSSSMIDRVAAELGRTLVEVPVGFKWFVAGLLDGSLGFGGEESAGASFLRRDGTVWTTDKDGLLLCLLAAEMTAVTGRDPAQNYRALTERHGDPAYARVDAPANAEQKARLKALTPDRLTIEEVAGDPVVAVLDKAPGNGAAIGGVKVVTEQAWFAARPSGTEDVYKIYGESFRGADHLARVLADAQTVVDDALA
jgi:phosphoglucomutase